MPTKTDRIRMKIWKTFMYHAAYRSIVKRHTECTNRLQNIFSELSSEQKSAIRYFQTSLSELHEAMLEIAVKLK